MKSSGGYHTWTTWCLSQYWRLFTSMCYSGHEYSSSIFTKLHCGVVIP
ncbi:hypothetical protein E1A91_A11G179500v1 [Gossypium mustelinum]|uniref:Uncharacterized protein n=1 Tax=Gossypium mustelinum TaxID=34275 RepID=A0A5D2X8K8_GOSMU|nr:hypothetical protein E1A91_A11G179500v1 [Gossypium mustelinum]